MRSARRRMSSFSLVTSPMTRIARPGERVTPDHRLGQTERLADAADLVLEQETERLDEVELHIRWEAADVVVGLNLGRALAMRCALDHVRVEGALGEEPRVLHLA